ncbi:hypothetical protein P9X10_02350 [Bacillus cereus]|nr:hypothetical protein [Bacillus cereus]
MATEKDIVKHMALSRGYKVDTLVKMPDDGSQDVDNVRHICRSGVVNLPKMELSTQYQISTNRVRNLVCHYWNCMNCGKTYFFTMKEDVDITNNNNRQQQGMNQGYQQQGYPQQTQYQQPQYQQGYANQGYPNQPQVQPNYYGQQQQPQYQNQQPQYQQGQQPYVNNSQWRGY